MNKKHKESFRAFKRLIQQQRQIENVIVIKDTFLKEVVFNRDFSFPQSNNIYSTNSFKEMVKEEFPSKTFKQNTDNLSDNIKVYKSEVISILVRISCEFDETLDLPLSSVLSPHLVILRRYSTSNSQT